MKVKLFFVLVLMLATSLVNAGIIDNVQVTPESPTISDSIEVNVFATLSYGEIPYSTEVTMLNNQVKIDIVFSGSGLPAITSWQHTENIGSLDIGTYDLVITTTKISSPGWDDEYTTEFTVVPEPASVLLLSLGAFFIRRKKRLQG